MSIVKTLYVANDPDGYAGWSDRAAMAFGVCPGVLPASRTGDVTGACQVSQRALGANWSVDIAPGWVILEGTDNIAQGTYAGLNSSTLNVPNPNGPPATLPRIDCLVARIVDSEYASGSIEDEIFFEWVEGTPTSGATLSNRLGAPTLPSSSLHIADLRSDPSDTTILNSMIQEKRFPSGPLIFGEDGKRYRLGVGTDGALGIDDLTV